MFTVIKHLSFLETFYTNQINTTMCSTIIFIN